MRPVVCFLLILLAIAQHAQAGQSSGSCAALLIGNGNYRWSGELPLTDPVKDARALGDELKRAGFAVDIRENLTKAAMRRALDDFYGKLRSGMIGLVFFSGYGIQVNRQTYLIPIDADIWNESEVQPDGVSLDGVLAEMNARDVDVKISIIDAAHRNNPFERRFRQSGLFGLAPVASPRSLVLFSAAAGSPGSVVPVDNAERRTFIGELLKEIRDQDVSAEEVFNRTRVRVSKASSNQQNPWVSSSLSWRFSFSNCAVPYTVADVPKNNPVADVPRIPCNVAEVPPPPRSLASPPRDELSSLEEMVKWNGSAYFRRAQLYTRYGHFDRAIPDLDKAILINPNDSEALNNRCWAYTILGQTFKALVDCDEALKIKPAYGDALDSRGLIYLKQCKHDRALSDYDAATKLNPRRPSSLFGRGIAKLRTGDRDGGNKDILAAKAIDPNIADDFRSYGISSIGN
jgi:hypothetical protein